MQQVYFRVRLSGIETNNSKFLLLLAMILGLKFAQRFFVELSAFVSSLKSIKKLQN